MSKCIECGLPEEHGHKMDCSTKYKDKSFKDGDPCVYCMQPGKLNKRGVCEYCEDPYGKSALAMLLELEEAILLEQE